MSAEARRHRPLRAAADKVDHHPLRPRGRRRAGYQGFAAERAGFHGSDRNAAKHDQQPLNQILHAQRHL